MSSTAETTQKQKEEPKKVSAQLGTLEGDDEFEEFEAEDWEEDEDNDAQYWDENWEDDDDDEDFSIQLRAELSKK